MKRVSSFLAGAIACSLLASPAWADNDTAAIAQMGATSGNTAVIEQITAGMGGNSAAINQIAGGYGAGGDNRTQVLQQFVDGSHVEVNQGGRGNDYSISQSDGQNLVALVNLNSYYGDSGGEFNTLKIEQSGLEAFARVEQSNSAQSLAEIRQSGWGGGQVSADIVQVGYGNRASIEQAGANLSASISQFGANLNATIVQAAGSFGNTATIRQAGGPVYY